MDIRNQKDYTCIKGTPGLRISNYKVKEAEIFVHRLDTHYRLPVAWEKRLVKNSKDNSSLDKSPSTYLLNSQYTNRLGGLDSHCIMTMSREEGDERAPGLQALIVAATKPFEEPLILSVEDIVGPNKDDVLGRCMLPLQYVDRRLDHKAINTRWFNLKKHVMVVEGK
ncbi:hypothetical protein Tco_0250652 [Tanacetum coccineum]